MKNYNPRTIDELGRLMLPKELREALGLETGMEVVLKPVRDTVILQKPQNSQGFITTIDELGRIALSKELRETMQWTIGDKIFLLIEDDGVLVLERL